MQDYRQCKCYDDNLIPLTGFVQTLMFSRTSQDLQRPNSIVLQNSKTHFQWLSRIHSIHRHGCMRSKSARTKSVFHVTALQYLNKSKCNMCATEQVQRYNSVAFRGTFLVPEPESKLSRTTTFKLQDFSRVVQDLCLFPGLEISI